MDPAKRTIGHDYQNLPAFESWGQIQDYVIRRRDVASITSTFAEMIQHLRGGDRGLRRVALGVKKACDYDFIGLGKRFFELLLK